MITPRNTNIYLQPVMPKQKLAASEKDEEWGKLCIDSIIEMGNQTVSNGRTSRYKKEANFNLVNSIFNAADFNYVTNPYNLNQSVGNTPARLQDFNIIRAKIELLKGEEIKRPFEFMAVAVNGEAVSSREEQKQKMLIETFEQQMMIELAKLNGGEPPVDEQGNPVQPPTPEQVSKFINTKWQDIREQMANQILQYGKYHQNLKLKFNEGWEHALIAGEEVYYIGIVNGDPVVRVVNTINFSYDKNPDLKCIEDAQWAKEERLMSVGKILDEFSEYLKDDDVKKLDENSKGYNYPNNPLIPGYAYTNQDIRQQTPSGSNYSSSQHILVTVCVWQSMRKLGFLKYPDENGEMQETMVDDTFKLTRELKAAGYEITWEWRPETWKGTKIGEDIYIDIAPVDNQIESKLPYVGRIYNSLNSTSTSLVDLAKPHQYTYIIVWYRLMLELAKAKGKKMVFDVAAIPKSQGIDVDKWMHYFDNIGIAFINSFEEGTEGASAGRTAVSQFNQYTAIDMSLSQVVQQYMMILDKLEDMVGEICGVSKQRQGQVASSETVGGVERSVVQSSMITESLFYLHNEVKKEVLTQYLECAKIAYIDGKKTQYIMDDIYRVMMDIDGEKLNESDYAVFVSNSGKDFQVKEKLEALAQVALQTDKAKLSDIIKIIKSNSISEIENTIKESEARTEQNAQASQDSAQQSALQQEQMRNEAAEAARQWQANENQLDRDNEIEKAQISAMGFDTDKDENDNGTLDILEISKLKLEESKLNHTINVEKDKSLKEDKKFKLEEDKMKSQERIKKADNETKIRVAKMKPKPKTK